MKDLDDEAVSAKLAETQCQIFNYKMMKKELTNVRRFFYLILIVLLTGQNLISQPSDHQKLVEGNWISNVEYFKFVLRVKSDENGSKSCSFDVPDQEAWNIPVDISFLDSSQVKFDIYDIRCQYIGTINDTGNWITGHFINPSGGKEKIDLVKTDNPPVRTSKRPQEPIPPYPYKSEEVMFQNKTDETRICGTLTLPDSPGPFKAAILLSGAGPNDRDQLIWGHRVFLVLADYLTRQGIAVLRYDDRGVGRSSGNYDVTSFEDFTLDALAAFEYLKSRSEIDPDNIGFIGHSEGGAIAPLAASKSDEVSFIILMAAPGDNTILGKESGLVKQFENNYREIGASEDAISFKCNLLSNIFLIAKEENDVREAKKKIRSVLENSEADLFILSEQDRKLIEMESVEYNSYDWVFSTEFLNILRYDPQSALLNVDCKVLALHGTKDMQIPSDELSGIEEALKAGGNHNYSIKKLEGLNHLFQTADTGKPSEYAKIEETIAPKALTIIAEWIKD